LHRYVNAIRRIIYVMFAPRARAILPRKTYFSARVLKMQPFIVANLFSSHHRVVFLRIFRRYIYICVLHLSRLFYKHFAFQENLAISAPRNNSYLSMSRVFQNWIRFCFHEACFRITNFSLHHPVSLPISLPFRGRMGTSDRGRIAYLRTRQNKTMWIISIPCTPCLCNMIGFRRYADACGWCNILGFPVSFSFLVPFHLERMLALLCSL